MDLALEDILLGRLVVPALAEQLSLLNAAFKLDQGAQFVLYFARPLDVSPVYERHMRLQVLVEAHLDVLEDIVAVWDVSNEDANPLAGLRVPGVEHPVHRFLLLLLFLLQSLQQVEDEVFGGYVRELEKHSLRQVP